MARRAGRGHEGRGISGRGQSVVPPGRGDNRREATVGRVVALEVTGRVEDRAAAILKLLELRGLVVTDAVRAEVLGCRDLPTLEHWFRRAAIMKSPRAVVHSRPQA